LLPSYLLLLLQSSQELALLPAVPVHLPTELVNLSMEALHLAIQVCNLQSMPEQKNPVIKDCLAGNTG
jgi:hypothetical protein